MKGSTKENVLDIAFAIKKQVDMINRIVKESAEIDIYMIEGLSTGASVCAEGLINLIEERSYEMK